MSIKDLEKMAVEININKNLTKVIPIRGIVEFVIGGSEAIRISPITSETIIGKNISPYITGYQRLLEVSLDPKTSTLPMEEQTLPMKEQMFKFKGASPIREGDKIRIGLILDKDLFKGHSIGNLLYLGILKKGGSFGRIDLMDNYTPTYDDFKKLSLD